MNLLILTQKVDINDSVLGFFHDWLKKFANKFEKVTVICLEKGEYDLPSNVEVLSLGKEVISSRFKYLYRFYKYIWEKRKDYDRVFVHMNPEYVILGGLVWRLLGKKIIIWYVHKAVNIKLKLAEALTHRIFTASKDGFLLDSKKVKILGHGIDTDKFQCHTNNSTDEIFKIIYVGRISHIKNQKLLIMAIDHLVNQEGVTSIQVDLVGSPIYIDDKEYLAELESLVDSNNLRSYINFVGDVPNKDMAAVYGGADLSVNLCQTGGMDKAVLESLSCGTSAIALNKTFENVFGDFKNILILEKEDKFELAKKISNIMKMGGKDKTDVSHKLAKKIVQEYSLENLIDKTVKELVNL